MQPFRVQPALSAAAMKTYQIAAPLATHWRDATCEEAGCAAFANGWQTAVDENTDLGQRQAHYIRRDRSREHAEERHGLGVTVFTFPAGQACFRPHKLLTGRPERFLVTGGDWRGNPLRIPAREHVRPDDWVEDMAGTLDEIRTAHERG
jgi:hypothetical protein